MIRIHDTKYHDPDAFGSLCSALKLWQAVADDGKQTEPYSIHFTFTCGSEARARRVAGALRRRLACAAAQIVPSARSGSTLWHVQGGTHAQRQSLSNLEQLSNWLRDIAASHQIALVRLSLV